MYKGPQQDKRQKIVSDSFSSQVHYLLIIHSQTAHDILAHGEPASGPVWEKMTISLAMYSP